MTRIPPFHSGRPGTNRYHNNNCCTEGNNIEWYWRRPGTGGHKLCHHCAVLNAQGR